MATVTLRAVYGYDVSSIDEQFPDDGSDWCGGGSGPTYRVVNKFDLSDLPADAIITDVRLDLNVAETVSATSLSWAIGPYAVDGQGDPETDSAQDAFDGCNVNGNAYTTGVTDFRSTGPRALNIAGAASDIEAALGSVGRFSVAILEETGTTADERTEFSEYTAAFEINRPSLFITYERSTFIDATEDTGDQTTYTFPDQHIEGERRLVIGVTGRSGNSGRTVSGVTVGGNPATEVIQTSNDSSGSNISALYVIDNPGGDTATIEVTFSGSMVRAGIAKWFIPEGSEASDTDFNNTPPASSPIATSLDIPEDGIAISVAFVGVDEENSQWIWTGLDEDFDSTFGDDNGSAFSSTHTGARGEFESASSGHTIEAQLFGVAEHDGDRASMVSAVFAVTTVFEEGIGTSAGSATVEGIPPTTIEADGLAEGEATAEGVSAATARVEGEADGAATVEGVINALFPAAGSSEGEATVEGAGAHVRATEGAADGAAIVSGDAAPIAAADGLAEGTAAMTAEGRSVSAAVGLSAGTAEASGLSFADAMGFIEGEATAVATGASIARVAGFSIGEASVLANGAPIARGDGLAEGEATVEAERILFFGGAGLSVGDATMLGIATGLWTAQGLAQGAAIVSAVGLEFGAGVGDATAEGEATVEGIGQAIVAATGVAAGTAATDVISSGFLSRLYRGANQIDAMYEGSDQFDKVYIGRDLVFQKGN